MHNKVDENIPSGFSMSTILTFKSIKSNDKDCMKKFCKSLKEHSVKIINLKEMKLLTK